MLLVKICVGVIGTHSDSQNNRNVKNTPPLICKEKTSVGIFAMFNLNSSPYFIKCRTPIDSIGTTTDCTAKTTSGNFNKTIERFLYLSPPRTQAGNVDAPLLSVQNIEEIAQYQPWYHSYKVKVRVKNRDVAQSLHQK